MAAFNDSADPELGAACNRLAAWVESLPEDALIDRESQLGEQDLALILRHLHATRHGGPASPAAEPSEPRAVSRPSVPVTAKS